MSMLLYAKCVLKVGRCWSCDRTARILGEYGGEPVCGDCVKAWRRFGAPNGGWLSSWWWLVVALVLMLASLTFVGR